jgi:hypothetical protein
MAETLLVALAAGAVGAVVGGGIVLMAGAGGPDAVSTPALDAIAPALERSVGRPLADLRRELAGLRTDLANAARPSAFTAAVAAATSAGVRDPALASGPPDADEPRPARRRRVPAETSAPDEPVRSGSAPDFVKLHALDDWYEKPEIRRRWLFAAQQEVRDWFGTPDEIHVSDGCESWCYEETLPDEDGDGESDGTDKFVFRFHDGRLISFDD